jgi:hypothetical protein
MADMLLPQAFWFRLALPCQRVDDLPRPSGRLLDLPASCALPETTRLDGRVPTADLRVAWNPRGLAIAVEAKAGPIASDPFRPEGSDGLQVWVDTRDTRDVHRATRFCHRFTATLARPGRGKDLHVTLKQTPIHRAIADAPLARPEAVLSRAGRLDDGWWLELFLTAEALHGFDPETNRRLGFAFQVVDPDGQDQFVGVGRDFPIGEDPSLRSTLELRDATE